MKIHNIKKYEHTSEQLENFQALTELTAVLVNIQCLCKRSIGFEPELWDLRLLIHLQPLTVIFDNIGSRNDWLCYV